MKTILISGARGFIARHSAKVLKKDNLKVIGISRTLKPAQFFDIIYPGKLGEPLKNIFDKHSIHTMIHCAYDKNDVKETINKQGTLLWAEQAEKNQVPLQIFISSISASHDATSPYGKSKFELEQWFLSRNHLVFRLGLVVGDGGIYQTITSLIRHYPFFPIIDRGKTLTYLTDIQTITSVIHNTIINEGKAMRGKVWNLQYSQPIYFRDILKKIKKINRQFCVFIPIPYRILYFIFTGLEKLKFLKLGINKNNLQGMRQNSKPGLRSDLKQLGYSEIQTDELIRKYS